LLDLRVHPEEKQTVSEDTAFLFPRFERGYPGHHDNHWIGACAEAVFGVKFHRPINRKEGPDRGEDFRLSCEQIPSGVLTIDIKGTIHDQFRLPPAPRFSGDADGTMRQQEGSIRTADRYEEDFIRRADHVYVLIQVVDRAHAFFRGFAFGSDEFKYHGKQFP
jgi:hypothetical protein